MKIAIDIGHNCYPDIGASAIRLEDELTKDVGNKVISKLKALGHEVISCLPSSAASISDSLYQRVNKANSNNASLYISIHFNSGGGRGVEAYAMSGMDIANKIVNSISTLNYINRGVKNGNWLYVVKYTNATAVLVECCFIDSQEDMNRYNGEDMANAIVYGITGVKVENSSTTVNDKILNLQKALNRLQITDFNSMALDLDGSFGPKTKSALNKFQKIEGIPETNYVDDLSINYINIIINKPVTYMGSSVIPAIRYIQYRVSTTIDGSFGNLTKAAVMKYQKSKGLVEDGSVGKITWTSLIG